MTIRKKNKSKLSKLKTAGLTIAQFLFDQFSDLDRMLPGIETPRAYASRLEGWPQYPGYHIRQEIKRMKKRGWIVEAEKQGKKFLKLTKKGKMQTLYRKLRKIAPSSKKAWDGKWRCAIFDIPEKGRHERDAIRWVLKSTGFLQWQKSVYLYPYEIPADVITYLKEANLLPFIRLARIDRLDHNEDVKKHFKL